VVRAVSKSRSSRGVLETAVKVVFLGLLVLIVIASAFLLLIFFVPVVVWYIWSLYDKTAKLEKRLAALEKPSDIKSEES
jgi:predicted membrane protein